ncbi:TetR/AcrR family transcriptional regulator [Pararhodobacter sp.]|uniref:TetR/AcrR family transcriptional regulator n=1 Tax=Pararhodobacter sp. TaxID=2127056 RepID=UPI002FDE2A34
MQERRSNHDRRQETRGALLGAARALFLEKGYAATGTPEVVERAGLTRGALYHHFKDKQALFLAVVEAEAAQIAAGIEAGSANAQTPLAALMEGAQAFFAAMRVPGRVRLMLLEGPAVLSPETMRRIDLETGGRELRLGLAEALGKDATTGRVNALADLVSALFDRAALAIAGGADAQLYEEAVRELLAVLVGSAKA